MGLVTSCTVFHAPCWYAAEAQEQGEEGAVGYQGAGEASQDGEQEDRSQGTPPADDQEQPESDSESWEVARRSTNAARKQNRKVRSTVAARSCWDMVPLVLRVSIASQLPLLILGRQLCARSAATFTFLSSRVRIQPGSTRWLNTNLGFGV